MTENVTPQPQLWLSYKCKDPKSINIRERLESLAAKKHISLVYDENGAEVGDSLIKFAQNLSASRFIILLINEEYFRSHWTLYEFVTIFKVASLDNRLVLPLPMLDTLIGTGKLEEYENNWQQDKVLRNGLANLLGDDNEAEHWNKIKLAWDSIIDAPLRPKYEVINGNNTDKQLEKYLGLVTNFYTTALEKSNKALLSHLTDQLSKLLNEWPKPMQMLRKSLRGPNKSDELAIAKTLLSMKVDTAIGQVVSLIEECEQSMSSESYWNIFLHDMEGVAGWLLLNSVEPAWWFNTELGYNHGRGEGVCHTFLGTHEVYSEVLISRAFLKNAEFSISAEGRALPGKAAKSGSKPALFFEAVSPVAEGELNILKIHNDVLRGNYGENKNIDQLLEDLDKALRSNKRRGKNLYYLVPSSDLLIWENQEWFKKTQQKLKGNILFVGYGKDGKSYNTQTCKEDEENLIETVTDLLRLIVSFKLKS